MTQQEETISLAIDAGAVLDIIDTVRQMRLPGWQEANKLGQRIELGQAVTSEEVLGLIASYPRVTAIQIGMTLRSVGRDS